MQSSLAELYVHGANVAWHGLYPSGASDEEEKTPLYRRLPLPTYPFQRKRYWLTPKTHDSTYDSVVTTSVVQPQAQHPLLGQRLHLADTPEIRFQSQISQQQPAFLADYQVSSRGGSRTAPTFPMTAYLEMALAAGADLFKSDEVTVEDLFIQQALLLPEDDVTTLQVVLKPVSKQASESSLNEWRNQARRHDSHEFKIFSLTASARSASAASRDEPVWTLHAYGYLGATAEGQTGLIGTSLTALQAQCSEAIPVSHFYQQASAYGFEYGASFQGIKQLWRGDRRKEGVNRALGRLRLPVGLSEESVASADEYQFHPALLDACCQLFTATYLADHTEKEEGERTETYVPMGVEQLTLLTRPRKGEALWGYAEMRPISSLEGVSNQELLTGDVHIFDDYGKPIAFVTGISMRRTTRQALTSLPAKKVDTAILAPSKQAEGLLWQTLADAPIKTRWNLLATEVRATVGQVLGTDSEVDSPNWLGLQQGFFDYGLDSLTSIELRNRLQHALGCPLPTTLAFRYSTVESLVNYLAEEALSLEFALESEVALQNTLADSDEVVEREVDELSDAEAEAWLLEELQALDYY